MSASSVKSAERALDVLRLLASRARPVPTMVISMHLGIPRSSTYHLLNVMRDRGWLIHYEQDHSWGLSSAALDLASGYLRSAPLQRLGRPLLTRLAAETGCATHLATLHGVDALYLDKQQPRSAHLELVTEPGIRLPAHLTAVGMAVLSSLSEDQVRALYGRRPLATLNGSGPTNLRQLFVEMRRTRERGYSYERSRVTRGVSCLAAAVVNSEGIPLAAVGVSWAERPGLGPEQPEIAEHVLTASEALGRQLNPPTRAAEPQRHAA